MQEDNDEWLENYGDLNSLVGLLKKLTNGFTINEIKETAPDFFIDLLVHEKAKSLNEELYSLLLKFGEDFKCDVLIKHIIYIFYDIGLVCVKDETSHRIIFSLETIGFMHSSEIDDNSKLYVHPMYSSALGIRYKCAVAMCYSQVII